MEKYYLWLLMVFGHTSAALSELMERFGTAEDAFNAFKTNIAAVKREYTEKAARISLDDAENLLTSLKKRNISFITNQNSLYPSQLLNTADAPIAIFAKGNAELLKNKLVTVSGARRITDYTIRAEAKVCEELCEKYTLVSSLTEGCEQLACLTAIKCGKGCIEVMPCGIEHEYPKNSRLMREQILMNGGCIISEYLPDVKSNNPAFIRRARISGGISKAMIIFQASVSSGSLNAAGYSPSVFFLPPNDVFNAEYAGAVRHIRNGANIYMGTEDIDRVFDSDYIPGHISIKPEKKKSEEPPKAAEAKTVEQKPDRTAPEKKTEKAPAESKIPSEELFETPVHYSVYKRIAEAKAPITFDEIYRNEEVGIAELSEILLDLEISDLITAAAGSRYTAKNHSE